nr:flavonol 3-sulfotransferase-like [Tanacetum cinerariifolium]
MRHLCHDSSATRVISRGVPSGSSGLQRFFRCARFIYSFYLCYSMSLYPFTERYAQPYFFSCLIRQMVNTRTDVDLSAAVQNALQTLRPQISAEIREEFRTSSGPSDSGGNPPPIFKTVPQHTCSWSKGRLTVYNFQGFWTDKKLHEGGIVAKQSFKARPSDVLLCSSPKTEKSLEQLKDNNLEQPLIATHLPYGALPKSVPDSKCNIMYIYQNIKDVIVSHYYYLREIAKLSMEDLPFEEAFDEFCRDISYFGPYWDHILGYWKADLENPGTILFLKYEDLKTDPTSNVKRLADFIGYPFSIKETKAGVVENIINMCSFENLSNLEVNKSGTHHLIDTTVVENGLYFRKAKDGDWKNYFTDEMKERIDELVDQKLIGTGLLLK